MLALSALGLCALPEPAQARCWDHQPRSWPEYKAACECEGGHATQHPLRCNHAGNSTAPVHPGLLQRQRWQLLLQKNIVDVASYAALPVNSDAELVAALVRLYAELYQGTAIWNAEVMTLKARYDVTMAQHKEFYGPRASRIDASDGLEPGIRADHQKARAKLTQLQAELKRVLAMRANIATKTLPQSEQMRREVTIATRRRIYYFVGRVRWARGRALHPCVGPHSTQTALLRRPGISGAILLEPRTGGSNRTADGCEAGGRRAASRPEVRRAHTHRRRRDAPASCRGSIGQGRGSSQICRGVARIFQASRRAGCCIIRANVGCRGYPERGRSQGNVHAQP